MAAIEAFKIVSANIDNAPELAGIHAATMLSPWSLKQWQDVFGERYQVYLAMLDEQPVACAVFYLIFEELELQTIAVLPEFEGLGIAQSLLALGIQAAESATKVFLEVDASNARAIALYERNDFKTTAIRKAYYSHSLGNGDALLMTKMIKETL